MLDDGDDSTRHETSRTDDLTAPGDLGHLDRPLCNEYVDPTAFASRGDFEPPHLVAGVDQDLDSVPLHNCTRVEEGFATAGQVCLRFAQIGHTVR